MKSLCIVFPIPARYFDDMIEACNQLDRFYHNASVRPLYIATMKRPYYFENARGEYGEFECGDRFLIFEGDAGCFHPSTLFQGRFPSPSLLKEIQWEGTAFKTELITIDKMLEQKLSELRVKMNTYCENEWIKLEDYAGFVLSTKASKAF